MLAFAVFLPLSAIPWLFVLLIALLRIVILHVQQHYPPLHPFTLFVPPQNGDPQLRLPLILQSTPDLLM
jgi:hypothetical protein